MTRYCTQEFEERLPRWSRGKDSNAEPHIQYLIGELAPHTATKTQRSQINKYIINILKKECDKHGIS